MDTDTLRRDLDAFHEADRFTPLMIFGSDYDFRAFALDHVIQYKVVMGFYQGIIEESFIVAIKDAPSIAADGMLKGQDKVLLLTAQEPVYGGYRKAYLGMVSNDGILLEPEGEFIGNWHRVSSLEALHSDAWTCYPTANQWYIAKMPTPDL